jgi:penicillin-binding protein 1A
VGYSGNMVGGIWMGNDDYSSTNRMTGGALPAMTWHAVMSYAHQGIEIKTIPSLPPAPPPTAAQAKAVAAEAGSRPPRPTLLTARGAEALVRIERMMEAAGQALASGSTVSSLPAEPATNAAASGSEAFASASGSTPAARPRSRAIP